MRSKKQSTHPQELSWLRLGKVRYPWPMYGEFSRFQSDYFKYTHFVSIEIGVLHHIDTRAHEMCSADPYAIKLAQ